MTFINLTFYNLIKKTNYVIGGEIGEILIKNETGAVYYWNFSPFLCTFPQNFYRLKNKTENEYL